MKGDLQVDLSNVLAVMQYDPEIVDNVSTLIGSSITMLQQTREEIGDA